MKPVFIAVLAVVASLSSAQTVPGIIAQLGPGQSAQQVANQAQAPLLDTAPHSPFALFGVPQGQNRDAVQARIAAVPGVVWAEDDSNVQLASKTGGGKGSSIGVIGDRDDLVAVNQRYLKQIAFYEPRAQTPGRSVRIAILDTGLSINQPGLWSKTVAMMNAIEPNVRAWDVPRNTDSNGNGLRDEGVGHGTMVAGLIDQVAPLNPLIVCRVADSDGEATAWNITKGLAFAIWQKAEVINLSLGAADRIPAMSDVLDWADVNGVLVVAPVGNANRETRFFPAGYSEVLAVAGVDGSDFKASFSNFHDKVNLSAPAVGFKSQFWDGKWGIWSGTSFSSPLVAGAIADCLRRRGKAYPVDMIGAAFAGGDDLNVKNPAFRDQLGRRLNIAKMNLRFANLPIRP